MKHQYQSYEQSNGLSFTVVSYNLADSSTKFHTTDPKNPDSVAEEKSRRQEQIFQSILTTKADVVCLQDVEDWNFWKTSFLVKKFGGYWKKRQKAPYGCCIFSKTTRFKEFARKFINSDECDHYIAQIVILEDITIEHPKSFALICNIQTEPEPSKGLEILHELEEAFEWIKKLLPEEHPNQYYPLTPRIILCGNTNFLPSSAIAQFMSKGKLEMAGRDPLELTSSRSSPSRLPNPRKPSKSEGDASGSHPTPKKTYTHCFQHLTPLVNADVCAAPPNVEPLHTPTFPLVDQIWYSSKALQIVDHPQIPELFLHEWARYPQHPLLIARYNYLPSPTAAHPPAHGHPYQTHQHLPTPYQPSGHHYQSRPLQDRVINGRSPNSAKKSKVEPHEFDPTTPFATAFNEAIMKTFQSHRPCDIKKRDRNRAVDQIETLTRNLEYHMQTEEDLNMGPISLSTERFGSTIFGLDSNSSDVDIVIVVKVNGERLLASPNDSIAAVMVIILKQLADLISREDKMMIIQKRFGASVPLVKAQADYGNGPVTLDVSILTELKTLKAAEEIRHVLDWHSAIPPFLFAVKQWAQCMSISDSYTGTINSYGWTNLAIWTLRKRYSEPHPEITNGRRIPNGVTACELFLGFLNTLCQDCFAEPAITMKVSDGSIYQNMHHLWVLLDPVDDRSNIIRTFQHQGLTLIQHAIRRTLDVFRHHAKNGPGHYSNKADGSSPSLESFFPGGG